MESVHYHTERMLPELEDLVQKGIFSKSEIKQILKKRTAFESSLIRRIAKKGDFLRYINYEMNLEALRRKRVTRLDIPSHPQTISDYALVRRIFYIFERAVRKFKGDIGLWVQYIDVAKRHHARALVGRICARALQLHPNEPSLYILSSLHELSQLAPTAARALLQRGLRLNPENVELWTEYVKMELGYVEGLRRRWEVLGIEGKGKGKKLVDKSSGEESEEVVDEENSEEARDKVMKGAIVKTVMSNAVKALPTIKLFKSLQTLLTSYPTPLRDDLLSSLHTLLQKHLPNDPEASILFATRHLSDDMQGAELVDQLKEVNEQIVSLVKAAEGSAIGEMYVEWVERWVQKLEEENLRLYLLHSLHLLVTNLQPAQLSAHALSGTVKLFSSSPSAPSPRKLLKLMRSHASHMSSSSEYWLARLDLERKNETNGRAGDIGTETKKVWALARAQVAGDEEGVEKVWTWALRSPGSPAPGDEGTDQSLMNTFDVLLRESMKHPSRILHTSILVRYISFLNSPIDPPSAEARIQHIERVTRIYLPRSAFFAHAFNEESGNFPDDLEGTQRRQPDERVLKVIFEKWRSKEEKDEMGDASLAWAKWLMENKKGKEASECIKRAMVGKADDDRERIGIRWKTILDENVGVEAEKLGRSEDV